MASYNFSQGFSLANFFKHHNITKTFSNPLWKDLPDEYQKDIIDSQADEMSISHQSKVYLTVYYATLFLVGVIGNLLTCGFTVQKSRKMSPTNCFLLNLAIVDLLTLAIGLPLEVYMIWTPLSWSLGIFGCRLVSMITEMVNYISIFTVSAFTFERFTAICYPLRPSLHSDLKRTKIIIFCIWIISVGPSCYWTSYLQLSSIKYEGTGEDIEATEICNIAHEEVDLKLGIFSIANSVLLYVFPMAAFPYVYSKIWKAMKKSEINLQPQTEASKQHRIHRKDVIKLQMCVIASFMICWLPFHLQRAGFVILTYGNYWTSIFQNIFKYLHHFSGAMYFINCVANPFLYTLLSKRYRDHVKDFLKKLKTCSTPNFESFATFSNVQSLERNFVFNQLTSFTQRKSMPNFTAVYQNGEARISFGQISRISKESNTPIIRSTYV